MHRTLAQRGSFAAHPHAKPLIVLLAAMLLAPWGATVCQQPSAVDQPRSGHSVLEDRVRKEQILRKARWRRSLFEFNEWLAVQAIYAPDKVQRMRADLARRVSEMSFYELEYLLESLDAKAQILDSPDAREAREWLGRYLAVMSDAKRAATLGELPDILSMTAAELVEGIRQVEKKRADVERQRSASLLAQEAYRQRVEAGHRAAVAEKARKSTIRPGVPFAPYRGPAPGSPPFPAADEGAAFLGIGPWGMAVSVDISTF